MRKTAEGNAIRAKNAASKKATLAKTSATTMERVSSTSGVQEPVRASQRLQLRDPGPAVKAQDSTSGSRTPEPASQVPQLGIDPSISYGPARPSFFRRRTEVLDFESLVPYQELLEGSEHSKFSLMNLISGLRDMESRERVYADQVERLAKDRRGIIQELLLAAEAKMLEFTRPVSGASLPTGQDSEPGPSRIAAVESGPTSDGEEMEEDQEADEEEVGDVSID